MESFVPLLGQTRHFFSRRLSFLSSFLLFFLLPFLYSYPAFLQSPVFASSMTPSTTQDAATARVAVVVVYTGSCSAVVAAAAICDAAAAVVRGVAAVAAVVTADVVLDGRLCGNRTERLPTNGATTSVICG